nr:c-type cytochrome [Ardenticatena sp.]
MEPFVLASLQALPSLGETLASVLASNVVLGRFLAVAAAVLLVVSLATFLLIGLVLWVLGAELPGLSPLFHALGRKRHEAPSVLDILGEREVKAILAGWGALWVLALALGYASGGLPGIGGAAQPDPTLRMIALALLLLTVVAILVGLLLIMILWLNGVYVPLLSDIFNLLSRKEPRGPRLQDIIEANKVIVSIISGWIVLWLIVAGALWFYPLGEATPTVASAPASNEPSVNEAPISSAPTAETPSEPQPTQAPAVNVNAPSAIIDLMINQGCGGCHTMQGVDGMAGSIGPDLTRIGSIAAERIAAPNYTGEATTPEEYIRESIINPKAYVVDGFPPVMPETFKDSLSPEQLDALVEFLASLK